MPSILSVSQINTYLKSIIDGDRNLKKIYIKGEISNFNNNYRSGHFYFTLKDEKSAIKAVMFSSSAKNVRFEVQNSMQVVVRASVSVYERDGTYQLYVDEIIPSGVGELSLAFEQLKNKLAAQGMFSDENKKPIAKMPNKIGVITSPTGAALQDILSVLQRRFSFAQIVFVPVQVQGDRAAFEISQAIKHLNQQKDKVDTIIVGRGGGSIEDLWAFNEEVVAHAIYLSEIPVISAVGHETDFTIADFVSDLRAPTPSVAAELAVPDSREVLYAVDKLMDSMNDSLLRVINNYQMTLINFENYFESKNPIKLYDVYSRCLNEFEKSINSSINKKIESLTMQLNNEALKLEYTNPLKTLTRGFALALNEDDKTIKSIKDTKKAKKLK
ncbi:MAG: exodeoxyribonuclease VII large subunit, partial [Clostridia bacterium]